MVYKVNQKFKVKDPEKMAANANYRIRWDGSICLKNNGQLSKECFNLEMQQHTEIEVAVPISANCFIGTDEWYWYDWMLDIPLRPTLMETE